MSEALLREIHGDVKVIREMAERHDRSLYGNGSPGLCSRVQGVEDIHEHCEVRKLAGLGARREDRRDLVMWTGVVLSVASIWVAIWTVRHEGPRSAPAAAAPAGEVRHE